MWADFIDRTIKKNVVGYTKPLYYSKQMQRSLKSSVTHVNVVVLFCKHWTSWWE